jgi:pyridoxamine 5'-phosphate oxidase
MTSMPDSLDAAWTQAWARLLAGARGRSDPFHQGVLATLAADGPQARYAVLRAVDPGAGTVAFHTDRRSPKCAQLSVDPRIAWCFFGHGEQVRLSGTVRLHLDDAEADAAWAASRRSARQNYAGANPPGTAVHVAGEGGPPGLGAPPLDEAGIALARGHFAFARFTVSSLDWLSLSAAGHARARFERAGEGWHSTWLTP